MLEATHRRIAKEIAKALKLSEREANLLESGSVNPDSWANFPHHKGKNFETAENILKARELYLQDDDECYHALGIALHYIEDKWTLRPRLADKHTKWENEINSASLLDDEQLEEEIKKPLFPTKAEQAYLAFLEVLKQGVFHPSISELVNTGEWILGERWRLLRDPLIDVLENVRGWGAKVINYALQDRPTTFSSPILDFNIAYRICLEVARNVFSQERNKEDWSETPPEAEPTEATEEYVEEQKEAPQKFLQKPALIRWETPYRPFGIILFIFSFVLLIIAFANLGNLLFLLLLGLAFIVMVPAILLYFGQKPPE